METCLERNTHERSKRDIKEIIDTWKPTPGHYIKLDISSLLQNIVEMEDAEDMVVVNINYNFLSLLLIFLSACSLFFFFLVLNLVISNLKTIKYPCSIQV